MKKCSQSQKRNGSGLYLDQIRVALDREQPEIGKNHVPPQHNFDGLWFFIFLAQSILLRDKVKL